MSARRHACGVAAAIAVLALPAPAGAEYLIPPGNSAATQYTEAVPTAGGHRDAEKQNSKRNRSPSEVLGARNTERLEAQGETGREAAEFAAETAPSEEVATRSPGASEPDRDKPAGGETERPDREGAESGAVATPGGDGPSGSGGLGEVAGQATGFSSGELGLLLPLAIVATAAWAVAFLLRRRQQPTP